MRTGAKATIAVAVLVVGSLAAAWQAAAHEHQDPVEVEPEYEVDPEEGEASGSAEVFMHDLTGFVPVETELTPPTGHVRAGADAGVGEGLFVFDNDSWVALDAEGQLFPGDSYASAEVEGQLLNNNGDGSYAGAEVEGQLFPGDQFVVGVEGHAFGTDEGIITVSTEAEGSASEAGVEDLDLHAEAGESQGVAVCSDGTVADQKVGPCVHEEPPSPPEPEHPLP